MLFPKLDKGEMLLSEYGQIELFDGKLVPETEKIPIYKKI